MPDTRLILHVKGTEAETTVLPKEEVRAAISQGQITHSQLIWIPSDNTWKPVRELPELLPDDSLILHVKGTEAETAQLPKRAVRAAISKGQITHSQLIWSSTENTWKQVRELPDLLPSQKLAPPPARVPAVHVPKAVNAIIPESPSGPVARAVAASAGPPKVRIATPSVATPSAGTPQVRVATAETPKIHVAPVASDVPQVRIASASGDVPKVRVATASGNVPQVRVATASPGAPQVRVAVPVQTPATGEGTSIPVPSTRSLVVKEDEASHPLKWVCIGLGTLILFILGANYLMVDQPLVSNMGQSSYSNVPVYAHFGAFMQPTVMVIHIPASTKITPDNLAEFLMTLAHSTPEDPITRDLFARVALTSGWTAQYSFSGYSWKQLGDMKQEDPAQLKEFLMAQMGDGSGQPLMPESTLNEEMQQSRRDQAWKTFVAHFAGKP